MLRVKLKPLRILRRDYCLTLVKIRIVNKSSKNGALWVWKKRRYRVKEDVRKSDSASGLFSDAVSTAEVKCVKGTK
jgi:hypothetical protein